MTRSPHNLILLLLVALFLTGCEETPVKSSGTRKLSLPDNASPVADGTGELTYRAKEDGRIFFYDADDDRIEARRMRAGQEVKLSPDINSATLDGRRVFEQDLKRNHEHRLYFEPE